MKPEGSVEGRRALEVVVCLEDSIVEVIHLRGPGQVCAGADTTCQVKLPAEALGGPSRVVLASLDHAGLGYVALGLGREHGGALRALADAEHVRLELEHLRVFVRWVPDVRTAVAGGLRVDRQAARTLLATTAAYLVLLALLTAIPQEAKAIAWLEPYKEKRLARVKAAASEDPTPPPPAPGVGQRGPAGEAASAAPAEGAQGRMGRPDTPTRGHTALAGKASEDRPGPGQAREWVKHKGVLGVMAQQDWSPVVGRDAEWGSHDRYAYGADREAGPGDGPGTFGGGYDGTGPGGCPPGMLGCKPGTIGMDPRAGLRIGGRDSGGEVGVGEGRCPPGRTCRGREAGAPPPRLGDVIVNDTGLDKAIVKRVIRSKLDAIGYCYERELTVKQDLAGTVTTRFVIDPNGAVISVTTEGGVSRQVDGCVAGVVRSMQFPRSSGMTQVSYPFTFHAAGR